MGSLSWTLKSRSDSGPGHVFVAVRADGRTVVRSSVISEEPAL